MALLKPMSTQMLELEDRARAGEAKQHEKQGLETAGEALGGAKHAGDVRQGASSRVVSVDAKWMPPLTVASLMSLRRRRCTGMS